MSFLYNKSEMSYDAALLLKKSNYYSSSVHCAYYSCIQLMKHLMLNKLGFTEDTMYSSLQASSENSHEFLINHIFKEMVTKKIDHKSFMGNITTLKKLRVKADYHNENIDIDKSTEAIRLSDTVVKQLKANF